MKLPSKALAAEEDITADCCICYAYRLPTGNPAAPGVDTIGVSHFGRLLQSAERGGEAPGICRACRLLFKYA